MELLAAVQQLAGPATGLNVLDRAQVGRGGACRWGAWVEVEVLPGCGAGVRGRGCGAGLGWGGTEWRRGKGPGTEGACGCRPGLL